MKADRPNLLALTLQDFFSSHLPNFCVSPYIESNNDPVRSRCQHYISFRNTSNTPVNYI